MKAVEKTNNNATSKTVDIFLFEILINLPPPFCLLVLNNMNSLNLIRVIETKI